MATSPAESAATRLSPASPLASSATLSVAAARAAAPAEALAPVLAVSPEGLSAVATDPIQVHDHRTWNYSVPEVMGLWNYSVPGTRGCLKCVMEKHAYSKKTVLGAMSLETSTSLSRNKCIRQQDAVGPYFRME
jgi:hypothetical protein